MDIKSGYVWIITAVVVRVRKELWQRPAQALIRSLQPVAQAARPPPPPQPDSIVEVSGGAKKTVAKDE